MVRKKDIKSLLNSFFHYSKIFSSFFSYFVFLISFINRSLEIYKRNMNVIKSVFDDQRKTIFIDDHHINSKGSSIVGKKITEIINNNINIK